MKKVHYLLLIVLFSFFACEKDTQEKTEFDILKEAKLPIPMKVSFVMTYDANYPAVTCSPATLPVPLPGKVWIDGNATHIGKVDETKSYAITTSCQVIDATHLKEVFEGIITTQNGDYFNFTGWGIIDLSNVLTSKNGTVTGEITANDGSGKFKGVKGTITMTEGTIDFATNSVEWNGEGELSYE
jgi:hypothetical protein